MDLNIEFDEDEILNAVSEQVKESLSEWISQEVRESFNYHEDRFRMSWMRMMEAELEDLVNSTKDNACNHGQKVYEGLFHVISEYFRMMREEAQQEDEDREQREVVQGESVPYYVETGTGSNRDDICGNPWCLFPQCVQAREAREAAQAARVGEQISALVTATELDERSRQADPEIERLLAEEEEIERRTRVQ